jgi:hypothetical protein
VELTGFSKNRELSDGLELTKELAHDFTRVFAATEVFELLENSGERRFRLGDGILRVVLTMSLEALVVPPELLAQELREALAGRTGKRPGNELRVDGRKTTLRGH